MCPRQTTNGPKPPHASQEGNQKPLGKSLTYPEAEIAARVCKAMLFQLGYPPTR